MNSYTSIIATRRENLRLLCKAAGSQKKLSDRVNREPVQINQFVAEPDPKNKNGWRNIGEKVAREFEELLGLPTLWMDFEHTGERPNLDINTRELYKPALVPIDDTNEVFSEALVYDRLCSLHGLSREQLALAVDFVKQVKSLDP